jgi:hypothetical protein
MKLCYDPVHWERVGHPANQYSKYDVSFLKTPPWPLPLGLAFVDRYNSYEVSIHKRKDIKEQGDY